MLEGSGGRTSEQSRVLRAETRRSATAAHRSTSSRSPPHAPAAPLLLYEPSHLCCSSLSPRQHGRVRHRRARRRAPAQLRLDRRPGQAGGGQAGQWTDGAWARTCPSSYLRADLTLLAPARSLASSPSPSTSPRATSSPFTSTACATLARTTRRSSRARPRRCAAVPPLPLAR